MSKPEEIAKEVIDAYDIVDTIVKSEASWHVKYCLLFSEQYRKIFGTNEY